MANRLNPLDPTDVGEDPDGDGLANLPEHKLNTRAQTADTDGDGAGDGAEVAAGTDPLRADQVPAAGPVLEVGAASIGFGMRLGDPAPAPRSFWVTNGGPGRLEWAASGVPSRLSLSSSRGNAPALITATVSAGQLPIGTDAAQIAFSAWGDAGSRRAITVTVEVLPAGGHRAFIPILLKDAH